MAGLDVPDGKREDLLSQPSRRRLFEVLSELGGAASTDQLAERLRLHPNGVRAHLRRMAEGGLLVHRRVGGARGRPRDVWAIAPTARPGGARPLAYGALSRWLARSIPATPARLAEVEATGREIGHGLAPAAPATPAQALGDVLTALGFQPALEQRAGGLLCTLRNCPYRDSVRENQAVVCSLHRGITSGVLERVAPAARLTRFLPRDPDVAGCEIEIEGLAA